MPPETPDPSPAPRNGQEDKRPDNRPDKERKGPGRNRKDSPEGPKVGQKLKTLKRALHLVWLGAPRWTIAEIVLLPLQAALTALPIYLSKLVIDAVATGLRAPSASPARTLAFQQVGGYIGLQAGVMLLSAILSALAGLARNGQSAHVTDYVTEIVHAKSIEVDLEYYENARYYDTLRRAQNQASTGPSASSTICCPPRRARFPCSPSSACCFRCTGASPCCCSCPPCRARL